jgi:argininosuccinate synthase
MMKRIVLAYSGSLSTTVAIPWLTETYGAEIVTVTVDLGADQELGTVRDRALAAGAVRAHVLDVREEFAHDYVLRALKADAMLVGASLSRPLLARKLVEVADMEQADAVAHGCTAELDHVRFDTAARALSPGNMVLAPALEWGMTRQEQVQYARVRGISVPASVDGVHKIDATLWGRSIKCGPLEGQRTDAREGMHTLTQAAEDCPHEAAYVEMTFERGVPTAINGVSMGLVELIASLGTIAGAHGVGRDTNQDMIYEAPAAVVLHTARGELHRLVAAPEVERFSHIVRHHYTAIGCSGLWFTPLREALDAYLDRVHEQVTGLVRLKLFKGDCRGVGSQSPFALVNRSAASHDVSIGPAGPAGTGGPAGTDRPPVAGLIRIDA